MPGRVRRRRRTPRLDEAGRVGRRRGRDVGLPRPPLSGHRLMTLQELRSIPLLDGLDRRPAGGAGRAPATRSSFEPGDVLFRSGQAADFWWLLLEGGIELVRHVGHEDTVLGTMSHARPVGRWVPGLGPQRRLHGDRPARSRTDGSCGCPPSGSPLEPRRGFPSASTSSRGSCRPCATSRRPRGSATRWWPWAPWRPGSRTRSTTRPRPRPGPWTPFRTRATP